MDKKKRWHIYSAVGFSCNEEGNDDTRVKLGDPGDYVKQISQISLGSLPLPLSCVGGVVVMKGEEDYDLKEWGNRNKKKNNQMCMP